MEQKLSIVRGRTETIHITISDASGNAYVLGNEEKLIFGVKKNYYDASYLIKKTLTIHDVSSISGTYILTLKPEDTQYLRCDKYFYDVGLQSGNDYYTVIECSHFILERNVTIREVTI